MNPHHLRRSLGPLVATSLCLLGCGRVVIGGAPGDGGVTQPEAGTGTGSGTGSGSGFTFAPPKIEQKVDLLFDIDNSASMGDKQAYLIQAIPQMITRLVTPRCVDASGAATGSYSSPTDGTCPAGSSPEFSPVHDLHIGVVTSSLGSRLGINSGTSPVCDPMAMVTSMAGVASSAFNDDQGHLITRTGPFGAGAALSDAALSEGGGFLAWAPTTTPVTQPTPLSVPLALVGDFTELVAGAGESGCGIESQLESWYRFLIQPDPYLTLVSNNNQASWSGVDTTILQQRHDFLRPDSLVAVIVLSDENDSEIDVRSYQGSGYLFMSNTFSPPRATSACAVDPNSAACLPCSSSTGTDPNCLVNGGAFTQSNDSSDWGYNLNLRHVHMRQKYGVDPQYPLSRYLNGLTSPRVPNRVGEYPSATSKYVGTNNCTNPLFAASLPQASDVPDATSATPAEISTNLCNLPAGTGRTAGDVFFAHIGGVPHELLQVKLGDPTCSAGITRMTDCPQKDVLSPSDWVKILGKGPAAYRGSGPMSFDYTGIDPHMIEAMVPRNQTALPFSEPLPAVDTSGTNPVVGPAFPQSAVDPQRPDPVNGREWVTNQGVHSLPVDRQYACIFQLPVTQQRDCAALKESTIEAYSCDCIPGGMWSAGGMPSATGNTNDKVPPLCSKTSTDGAVTSAVSDYTVQTHAKAYPTIRELMLANMMGSQGIVSSMCPIHSVDNATGDDPLYGYRPAMDAIVNRMRLGIAR